MTVSISTALGTIIGNAVSLQQASGAGRAFELLVMTSIATGLKAASFDVWLQRSDETVIHHSDADRTFVQRGGAPTGIAKKSDGAHNASVIGFRWQSGPAWEIWNGIQFQGRSTAKHEFDIAIVPASVGQALRLTGGPPTGRPRVAIECKDVGGNGSLDEMRAFVARLYDTTLLQGHYFYLGLSPQVVVHPNCPPTYQHSAAKTFWDENHRTRNILARRTDFSSGALPLAAYHRIEPRGQALVGSSGLTDIVSSVVAWANLNAK